MTREDVASFLAHDASARDFLGRLGTLPPAAAAPDRARDTLRALAETIAPRRILLRPGDELFRAGMRCKSMFVLNGGIFRVSAAGSGDPRRHGGYRFRGDWLGLDAVASGRHASTAVALDTAEVWALPLDALAVAGALQPLLLEAMRNALAFEHSRTRIMRASGDGVPAEIRVADFLLDWLGAVGRNDRSADRVALRVTCAELGAYLDIPIDTLDGALSILVGAGALRRGRHAREAVADDADALTDFLVKRDARATLQ